MPLFFKPVMKQKLHIYIYVCVCVNLSDLMMIHKVLSFIGGQEEPTPGKMTFQ